MGLDELTDRERAVAVAARTGASAKAIGEQLFLSPRTVETHLGAIYRKLGVTTRGALIALLHTQPDPPAPAAQLALPVMLPVTDGFVGRAAEIAALGSALAAARRGERATVMIGGEPGIGKSTLAGRVAADAHASGALVLAGRCDPDFGAPFGPVADALRPYLASHADPAKAGGPTAGSLAALLPELAARLPAPLAVEDAATSRRLLVEAVRHVLREAAAAAPVLLVLEDLHWADRATIALVRQLVTAAELAGLVLVTTFRNDELVRAHPLPGLLADLWREPTVVRLDLDGLPLEDTARLAGRISGADLDAARLDRLQARTDGNPFFVLQLVSPGDGEGVPGSLREVVLDRVGRLGDPANRVLGAASVVGSDIDPRLLVEMAHHLDIAEADVGEALDAASSARLLERRAGSYRFTHDLVRESLHDELNAITLARVHAAAGHALLTVHAEDLDPFHVELATHFGAAAALGEGVRAATHGLAAARQAIVRLAPDDALALATVAGAHLPVGAEHDPVRLGLKLVEVDAHGIRMDLAAHREATLQAVAIARRTGDPGALADTVDRIYIPPSMGAPDDDLLAVKLDALDALGQAASPRRTRLLASLSYQRTLGGDGWEAIAQAEQAVQDARALDDPDSIVTGLYALASATRGLPDLAPQLAVAEELIELGDGRVELSPERNGWRFRAVLRLARGDRSGFEADVAIMDEFAGRSRSVFVRSTLALWRTLLALLDGDLPGAEEHAATVVEVSVGHPNFALAHFVELAETRTLQGRPAEMIPAALAMVDRVPGLDVLRALTARLHLDAGDGDAAGRLVAPLYAGGSWTLSRDWLRPPTLAYLAPVARAVLDERARTALAEELAPYAGQLVVAGPGALVVDAVDHCRGILLAPTEPAAATALLTAAAALAEHVGSPVLADRSRRELARVGGG